MPLREGLERRGTRTFARRSVIVLTRSGKSLEAYAGTLESLATRSGARPYNKKTTENLR